MAKYIKQQLPDLNGKGEDKSYYRIQKYGNVSTKELLHRICDRGGSGLSRGTVINVLETLSDPAHPCMCIADYVELTGLSRTTATLELQEFRKNPESGIDTSGRGTSKVYVKRSN